MAFTGILLAGCNPASETTPPVSGGTLPTDTLTASNTTDAFKKLEINDIKVGLGDLVADEGDLIVVGYEGSFPGNGKTFDTNTDFNDKTPGEIQPYSYLIGNPNVILGWAQGLKGIKKGGVRELMIPYELAYGKEGSPTKGIAPMQDLKFKIECLYIVKKGKEGEIESTDVVIGPGQRAGTADFVKVHYTGRFLNGLKFDSSYGKSPETPLGFRLGKGDVIKGWDDGILGMKIGGKRNLIIPPLLAYGINGNEAIGPHQVLEFDVELTWIEKK